MPDAEPLEHAWTDPHIEDLAANPWRVRLLGTHLAPGTLPPEPTVHAAAAAGVAATVPGAVHTDLIAAGLLPDPFRDDHADTVRWVGESDWEYATTVDVAPTAVEHTRRAELVLEGLATLATVRLNGTEVASTANAYRAWHLDVTDLLRAGPNDLTVTFASAARAMREADDGALPYDWAYAYNRVRVMACSVGWDWAPTLVTAGLWRAARLETWSGVRLRARAATRLSADLTEGTLVVDVVLDGPVAASGTVQVSMGDHVWQRDVDRAARLELPMADPAPWWPRGYGDPVRHDVVIRLVGTGQELHRRVGFRHVTLDTTPDAWGRSCTLVVNGQAVFARGANWVPDDLLLSRMTPARYAARVTQAVQAEMTMLRVWGGGTYEDEAFYEACDEAGLLVWQDFAFACAAYPEDEPFAGEVAAEAREQVRRLASHPCIVVWNGSNETLLGWADWGWPERVGTRAWGEVYYRGILPDIVAQEDPGTPYVPSSPFSTTPGVGPNVDGEGSTHLWDQWNLLDHTTYRDHVPRFAAELGFQAPPTWRTLTGALSLDPRRLTPTSPALASRQKQSGGMTHLLRRLDGHVPDPDALVEDLDDWLWATQLNQADALRTGAEHLRGHWPRTAGCLVWQLNDAWPGISWSLIDHDGRPKPALYAVQRAFAPRLVTLQPRDGATAVVLVNDTDTAWDARVLVQRVHVTDGPVAAAVLDVPVGPRAVAQRHVPPDVALPHARREEVLVADAPDDPASAGASVSAGAPTPRARRAVAALCREDGVRWPRALPHTRVVPTPDGVDVEITADVLIADVTLLADRIHPDARVADALHTLLPGESVTVHVALPQAPDAATRRALVRPPVLRTRNDLWHR